MRGVFTPLPRVPDHPELGRRCSRWDAEQTFERLREQVEVATASASSTAITANNPMGVHHAEGGRSGRLPALQGVARLRPAVPERLRLPGALGGGRGREVALGLKLEAGHRGVRPRRVRYPLPRTRRRVRGGNDQPGQATGSLDGLEDNDYYTFSDTNIEYIWRFLKTVHERGWLYRGLDRRNGAPAAAPRCRSTNRRERRITRSSTTRRSTFGFR